MDLTSALVVLIFVSTLFSTIGDRDVSSRASYTPSQVTATSVNVEAPPSDFVSSMGQDAAEKIQRFVISKARKISREEIDTLVSSIMKYSEQYNVNPRIAAGLIDRESGFDPSSVSSSNAQGLGQLLPSTSAHIGIRDPFDIEEGTKGAILYYRMMLDKWVGSPDQVKLALASYAEGPNQVLRNGGSYSDATARYVADILTRANSMN